MNYNAIDIDEEVAFVNYRSRGGPYPMFARRGLVLDKRKRKKWQNKSMTGELLVEVPTIEASRYNPNPDFDEAPTIQFWISAYNVIDFWDRYEQEREHLYGDQLRSLEQAEKERLDREAARMEEIELKRQRNFDLQQKIERGLGLPHGSVTIGDHVVTINRSVIESRLSERTVT
jgi:hypothetical protein